MEESNTETKPIEEEGKDLGGRPTIFTPELALRICERLSGGESLRRICEDEDMPAATTVHQWVLEDKEGFSKQYARARDIQAEVMFDEILDIADDGSNDLMTITKGDSSYEIENREVTSRSKLRVESRKWYLSKVVPKKFGDKMDVTSGNKPIPLLNVLRNNDSNKEDSSTEETH